LQGLGQAVVSMREIRKKRKQISKHDVLNNEEFAARLSTAEKTVLESIMRRRDAEGKKNWLLDLYRVFFCRN
ncbi:hypothetical protein VU10_08270, partial [Desulfobulbus sp. US1]|nr:hypothetical protein [Desulfobulbus sp. US1]